MLQHYVNGGDTGQTYDFVCDECEAVVIDRTPVQMLSMLTTLPALALFGAFAFFFPLGGVVEKLTRGTFRFDFGGFVILGILLLGALSLFGSIWGSFSFVRNQVRLGKAKVIKSS